MPEKVNDLLDENDGWSPLGSVAMSDRSANSGFSQAMANAEIRAGNAAHIVTADKVDIAGDRAANVYRPMEIMTVRQLVNGSIMPCWLNQIHHDHGILIYPPGQSHQTSRRLRCRMAFH